MAYPVKIMVYDLAFGLPVAPGTKVYHTSVNVHSKEFVFGQQGIMFATPGAGPLGNPVEEIEIGFTTLTYEEVLNILFDLKSSEFAASTYDFFLHNCNSFTDRFVNILTSSSLPDRIKSCATKFLNSFIGRLTYPILKHILPKGRKL